MRIPRIFSAQKLQINASIELEPGPSQHLSRVLRMKPGDSIILFDGTGGQYPATISALGKKCVVATTADFDPVEHESGLCLHLGIAISRGERMDWVVQKATELGVINNIKFEDFVSQPQQLMQICDCVILASGQETFGLVLPEAMRAGVAVIGSNSGGVPEIITHEETGLLFETKNANNLYQQIERLYLDPDFKNKLAQQGKQSADNRFNNTMHFQQLEQHLESAIN